MVQVVLEDAKTQDKPAITPGPEPGLSSLTAREIEKKLQESEDRSHASEAHFLRKYIYLGRI